MGAITTNSNPPDVNPTGDGTFRKSAGNTIQTLVTTFGVQGVGLLTGVLVARMLGPEGRGILAAVTLWPSLVIYLGDLGVPIAYAYEAARDRKQVPALVGNALVLTLAQWIVLALVGLPAVRYGLHRFGPDVLGTGICLLVWLLPLNLSVRYLISLSQGVESFVAFNVVRVSVPITYAVFLFVFFFAGLRTVGWAIWATILSNVVALGVSLIVSLIPLVRTYGRPRLDLGLIWRNLGYGLRAHIGNLTPVDSMRLDLLVVTILLGATDAGLYSVAISAAAIVRAQGTALGMVALPTVAGQADEHMRRRDLASFVRLTLLLSAGTALVAILGSGPLIRLLYGAQYLAAASPLKILMVGIVAAALRQVVGDGLRGLGRPMDATVAEVASWVVGAGALALFVPRLGVLGAAVGVASAYVVALLVSLGFASRAGMRMGDLLILRASDFRRVWGLIESIVGRFVRNTSVGGDGA